LKKKANKVFSYTTIILYQRKDGSFHFFIVLTFENYERCFL